MSVYHKMLQKATFFQKSVDKRNELVYTMLQALRSATKMRGGIITLKVVLKYQIDFGKTRPLNLKAKLYIHI